MGRGEAVADKAITRMFGDGADRLLSRADVMTFALAIYEIGFLDGRRVQPKACEKCGVQTDGLSLIRFVPGMLSPPGAKAQQKKLEWMCVSCRAKAMPGE